jgi:hypothetical protein
MTDTMTPTAPAAAPDRTRTRLHGLMAEFDSPTAIMEAALRVRAAGYTWWDTYTPFPVHGLDKAMGIKPTVLPILVFFAGLTGCIAATVLQWFTNAESFDLWAFVWVRGYDFLISGKPLASVPAWIPVMFEMTILFAVGAAFALALLMNGLPRWYHPCFKSERFARVTDDRFFLVIEARDPKFYRDDTEQLLRSLEPLSLEALEA